MRREVLICMLIGAAAGMVAGLLGVGGGIFLVPLLVGVLGVAQHQAHGTSLAVIAPIALVGAITYALLGHMDWVLIPGLALGGLVGVVLGAKLMASVPAGRLRWIFGIFMVFVGIYMIITWLGS
ncbi:MAG: TSUP family transporter [Dehalococcoidia bacterium]